MIISNFSKTFSRLDCECALTYAPVFEYVQLQLQCTNLNYTFLFALNIT